MPIELYVSEDRNIYIMNQPDISSSETIGVTGENNATVLRFSFFEELNGKSVSDFEKFVVALFPEGEKSYKIIENCFKLPSELTAYTEIILRVDMKSDEDVIFRTAPSRFVLVDSNTLSPYPEIWHPLIGDINNLDTEEKENLVNAINEVLRKANQGGGGTGGGGNGVGIERIEQTTTSTESSGKNVITVYLTNGDSYNLEVTNGRGIKHVEKTGQSGLPLGEEEREFSTVYMKTLYSDNTSNTFSFLVPYGKDGKNYILTEADKAEIAQQAAGLIDTALLSAIGSGVLE